MKNQEVDDMVTPKGMGIITYEQIFRIIDKLQKRVDKLEKKIFTVESPPKQTTKIPNIMEDKKKVKE